LNLGVLLESLVALTTNMAVCWFCDVCGSFL